MATPAPGGMDLATLIKSMSPSLHPATFVWATVPSSKHSVLQQALLHAEMLFREDEGFTFISTQDHVQELGLDFTFPCRKITLNVHSSLEAYGFLAAVAERLTRMKLGCNCVAGYFHDHIFVPVGKEDVVLSQLQAMAEEQR
ncbi:hypothetical protein LTR56_017492 [Elasticomyces elasticus]|nr:hypothetical protein LTR56_017492 [Elasticomyces elasticus]KAK3640901.1 hypothetical protein LTR22_016826 [Elasticomyces elasticus]KAK5759091.1 hypothetical protein LTS12_010866 [Elasticomyces elasticus]